MKIAIVCGHFLPNMGYLEVHLANSFHQLNHEVKVFTSRIVPKYVKSVGRLTDETPYEIVRLRSSFKLGQMVKSKRLIGAVEKFEPELVICIGLGKLFPKPIYHIKNRNFKLVTLLGDNEDTYSAKGYTKKLKNTLLQQFLKKTVYQQAIMNSDALFPYTPSTVEIVTRFVNNKSAAILKSKSQQISLGFDIDKFFFSLEERKSGREKLKIDDDTPVLITATRIIKHKKFEDVIDLVNDFNKSGKKIHYVLIGFFEDEYCNQLRQFIKEKEFLDRFHCFPFLNHKDVREYYQAADIAYFPTAVISIFEAMGTGTPVILPNRDNVSHIVKEGDTGWYFDQADFKDVLTLAYNKVGETESNSFKKDIAEKNKDQFSYSKIAERILFYSFKN